MTMAFDPAFDFFSFPLVENEPDWHVITDASLIAEARIGPRTVDYDVEPSPFDDTLSLVKKEYVTVPAGRYESYKVSGILGDVSKLWYSPEAGYFVKVDEDVKWEGIDTKYYLSLIHI